MFFFPTLLSGCVFFPDWIVGEKAAGSCWRSWTLFFEKNGMDCYRSFHGHSPPVRLFQPFPNMTLHQQTCSICSCFEMFSLGITPRKVNSFLLRGRDMMDWGNGSLGRSNPKTLSRLFVMFDVDVHAFNKVFKFMFLVPGTNIIVSLSMQLILGPKKKTLDVLTFIWHFFKRNHIQNVEWSPAIIQITIYFPWSWCWWWQLKYLDYLHPELPREMIQFDEHIFQMGWFNHQLVDVGSYLLILTADPGNLLSFFSHWGLGILTKDQRLLCRGAGPWWKCVMVVLQVVEVLNGC